MFSVSSGGRDIAKNTLAPQTKITIVMMNGITVQAISSAIMPWSTSPTLCGSRRR